MRRISGKSSASHLAGGIHQKRQGIPSTKAANVRLIFQISWGEIPVETIIITDDCAERVGSVVSTNSIRAPPNMHHRVPRPKTWHIWYRNPPLLVTPGNVPRLSGVEKVEGPAGKTSIGHERQFKVLKAFFKVFGGFVGDFSRGFRLLEPSIASRCDNAPIRCRTCARREAFIGHARARRPPPD